MLKEVSITEKYDPNKHLYKLLENNLKKHKSIDTTIYYAFEIKYDIPSLNQSQIMKGILRHEYKKSKYLTFTYICKLDLYSNTIKDDTGVIPNDYLHSDFDNNSFDASDIKSDKKQKKHIDIIKNGDTTIFKLNFFNKEVESDINQYYYGFIKNKNIYKFEKSFEYNPLKTSKAVKKIAFLTTNIRRERNYCIYDYAVDDNILYLKSITRFLEYSNIKDKDNPIKMSLYVHAVTIPKPNLDLDLNIRVGQTENKIILSRIIKHIEIIKEKYPDLVIPSSE